MVIQLSLEEPDINSLQYIPKSVIAGLYDSSGFDFFLFLRTVHTVFHNDVHFTFPPTLKILIPPYPHQPLLSLLVFVVFIHGSHPNEYELVLGTFALHSQTIRDAEHLFMCLLTIHISSLEKCLFKTSYLPFLNWVLCFVVGSHKVYPSCSLEHVQKCLPEGSELGDRYSLLRKDLRLTKMNYDLPSRVNSFSWNLPALKGFQSSKVVASDGFCLLIYCPCGEIDFWLFPKFVCFQRFVSTLRRCIRALLLIFCIIDGSVIFLSFCLALESIILWLQIKTLNRFLIFLFFGATYNIFANIQNNLQVKSPGLEIFIVGKVLLMSSMTLVNICLFNFLFSS